MVHHPGAEEAYGYLRQAAERAFQVLLKEIGADGKQVRLVGDPTEEGVRGENCRKNKNLSTQGAVLRFTS